MKAELTKIRQSGFSTLELMLAMVILVMVLSAVMLVVFGNQAIALDNQVNAEALIKASDMLEKAKMQARTDFYNLSHSASTEDIYDMELLVTEINPCKKSGIANVSWQTDAREMQVNLNTTFINTSEAVALAGDCGSDEAPVSEWWFPTTLVSDDFKIGNNGTKFTGIDVVNLAGSKHVVLSSEHSDESQNDLWLVNVAGIEDSLTPTVSGYINADYGLSAVDAAGTTAFALSTVVNSGDPLDPYVPSELYVFDIADPAAPALLATRPLDISGTTPETIPSGLSIFYHDSKVYIGAHRTAGPEFQIFDVSVPGNPVKIGTLNLSHNVFDIFVRGSFAFLATSDDGGEFMAVDISDPTNLIHPDVSGFKYNAAGEYNGRAVFVLGNKAYLGRTGGYSDSSKHNFLILDVSDPSDISVLGSKFITRNPTQAMGITEISVSGTLAFLGTEGDSNAEFQVFKIDVPSAIRNCNEAPPPGYSFDPPGCGKYNFPAKVTDIEYHDGLVYASVESNDGFRAIQDDVSEY